LNPFKDEAVALSGRKLLFERFSINAIKRKNPLCLINPIFLDVRW